MTGHVIHLNTSIHASPEAVWEVLTDIPHHPDILRSVKSTRLLTDGGYDVGTTWSEERTFFGHHGQEELHVTESDAPRRTLHETKLRHDAIRTAWSIQPNRDDTTRLLVTATMDVSGRSPAEKVLWNAFGGHSYNATRKMLAQDLEDIRVEAEKRSGAVTGRHRAS
ncbi:SRPBCC family protein [Nocardioides jiangxiensis]|uniref:SRPBCC family protein n=1 Tax=Nocardioides jiangxiensis TaxID=3064524 RepID=A0ABT9B3D1_9ACTN|nr:SRPBCC family protein [Nocardioides sp. WY-20]MDO7869319.1 SRPBCC family protein [Nocardioides sp. WY-20]